jgi:eukaryotic-like serine/threonine-protein kinase
MLTASSCSACGAKIRVGSPEGLCPRCLLRLALQRDPAPAAPAALAGADARRGSAFGSPRLLGDFELLEEIARGGMGIVYRARQVSLNRIVAVKVLLFGQFASAEFVKRFRAEAEAVARLHHPSIVGIHAVGEHENQPYFSMDYIEGGNLAALVKEQPLSARQAGMLVNTIAAALDYAHGRGILHRDLKPSNVLMDAAGQPHLTDFGLAKRLDGDNPITVTGQIFGSPGYMAPEQASPGRQAVGRASDIYSLGAILYFLVTGRPPFLADSVEATLTQVLTADIVSPRNLNPSIPPDLETICLKCLEREPDRRYATAGELAAELGRFLLGEPIQARPVSALERSWRWVTRNRVVSTLGALVIVLVAAFLAHTMKSSSHIRREAERAILAEQQARSQLWESYLLQARAERRSGEAGQRYAALAAISNAAAIRPSLELRNEAIAALALPDVRVTRAWQHPAGNVALAYSASLERFAVQRPDGQISVCLASNGQEFARLPAVGRVPCWIADFTSDESRLAVNCYEDSKPVYYVWDIAARKPVLGPIPGVSCAFLPDGSQFVVAGLGTRWLDFYSLTTGRLVRSLPIPEPLSRFQLHSRSEIIVGYNGDTNVVHVLDLGSGAERFALSHPATVGSTALSQDGGWLAVGCYDGRIIIWDARTGVSRAVLEGHENNVTVMAFNHAVTVLASTGWDDTFRLWDTASWKQILRADGTSTEIKFGPGDHSLAHLQQGNVAGVLEIASSEVFRRLHVQPHAHQEGWCVTFSPDARLVATAHTDGVAIRDAANEAELAWLPIGECRSVMFVPDGTALVTSGKAGLAYWRFTTSHRDGTNELVLGERHPIREGVEFVSATLSGDGQWVAAAIKTNKSVAVYEVAHPENHFEFTSITNIESVAATADMRWLATGAWGRPGVKVYNLPERRLETELPFPDSARVSFSPDGRFLAAGGVTYEVWQTGTWRKLYEVRKPDSENPVGTLSFSPDSRWLALIKQGREIVLLEAATGNELATFQAPRLTGITALCFSPNASKLVALQTDQSLQVWDLSVVRRELASRGLNW